MLIMRCHATLVISYAQWCLRWNISWWSGSIKCQPRLWMALYCSQVNKQGCCRSHCQNWYKNSVCVCLAPVTTVFSIWILAYSVFIYKFSYATLYLNILTLFLFSSTTIYIYIYIFIHSLIFRQENTHEWSSAAATAVKYGLVWTR